MINESRESKILNSLDESAKDALILDKDSKSVTASQIALNIQSEADAVQGYEVLIPWLEKYNDTDSISHVREVIADEKNHIEVLNKILKKYDNIEPNED